MIIDKQKITDELNNCKEIIDNAQLPLWDDLPKLELYMDQV